jgi:PRC-barrel domain protein
VPDPASWLVIEKGWKVLAADGSEVGTVAETLGDENHDIFDGLAVSTGLLSKPVYVPSEQVGEIVEGAVKLSLDADAVKRLEPYEPPRA